VIGAITGDIAGSRFEWDNYRKKDFELLSEKCFPTDDSYMTLAVADALTRCRDDLTDLGVMAAESMRRIGRRYPDGGYGRRFKLWLMSDDMGPYQSMGNGAAMRVSACGYAAWSLDEAREMSRRVTEVTHDHPEGLKAAEAVASAVYLAKEGLPQEEIRDYIESNYYRIDFTLDDIRDTYRFDETCGGSVPQALEAFFEAEDFEDAIRNAVSVGGDSDTIAAIAGGIAEAYFGVPSKIRDKTLEYLDAPLRKIVEDFEAKYPR